MLPAEASPSLGAPFPLRRPQDALPLLRALCLLRWQPALTAFFARVAEAQQDAAQLLSELFAAPPEAEPAEAQLAAAQQAAALLQQRAAAAKSKKAGAQQGERAGALLGRLCLAAGPVRWVLCKGPPGFQAAHL